MHRWIHKKAGFTLIEIVIALAILAGATIIISRIWSGNRQRVHKISDYHKIVQLMEQKINELEFEWRVKNFQSIPREQKGDFPEEENFSWSVKTQPLSLPDPQLLLNSIKQNQDMVLKVAKTTNQLLSQAVLEAKLTIHYKKGLFKSKYSLTTYIIDHKREIQLSIPTGP